MVFFDGRVPSHGINLRDGGIIGGPRPNQIIEMIQKSEDIIVKYKALMPDEAYLFIANESKCYFYTFSV
jgi:hypothetical protein